MDRRTFIQNSIMAASGLFFQSHTYKKMADYSLVIVRGGSPGAMLDIGMEALGGTARFFGNAQTVLIKPTIQWDQGPDSGANTNPDLLAELVKQCYQAGSKGVYLLDQTKDSWTKCYKNSGIERAVKDAGAKILPADKEFLYQEVEIPGAKMMKKAKIHQAVLETDLIINVPAVKPDAACGLFGAFENLKGLIWQEIKAQGQTEQQIIDFLHFRQPVLNIMDLYRVWQNDGSTEAKDYKTLILSTDIVSANVAAARRLGIDPASLNFIGLAARDGFGEINLPPEKMKNIVLKRGQSVQ